MALSHAILRTSLCKNIVSLLLFGKRFDLATLVKKKKVNLNLHLVSLKNTFSPWLVWLSGLGILPDTKMLPVRFQSQGTCLGCGPDPWLGDMQDATDWCFPCTSIFLTSSFSLLLPLSKNKKNKIFKTEQNRQWVTFGPWAMVGWPLLKKINSVWSYSDRKATHFEELIHGADTMTWPHTLLLCPLCKMCIPGNCSLQHWDPTFQISLSPHLRAATTPGRSELPAGGLGRMVSARPLRVLH